MPYCKNTSLQLQLTGFMLGICVNVIIKGMYNVYSVYYPLNSSLVLANIVQLFFFNDTNIPKSKDESSHKT